MSEQCKKSLLCMLTLQVIDFMQHYLYLNCCWACIDQQYRTHGICWWFSWVGLTFRSVDSTELPPLMKNRHNPDKPNIALYETHSSRKVSSFLASIKYIFSSDDPVDSNEIHTWYCCACCYWCCRCWSRCSTDCMHGKTDTHQDPARDSFRLLLLIFAHVAGQVDDFNVVDDNDLVAWKGANWKEAWPYTHQARQKPTNRWHVIGRYSRFQRRHRMGISSVNWSSTAGDIGAKIGNHCSTTDDSDDDISDENEESSCQKI